MLDLTLDDFLLHAGIKFELERLKHERKTGQKTTVEFRNKWIKKLAKGVLGTRADYGIKIFCKSIRSCPTNKSAWIYDQYFQFLFRAKPRGDCYPLDYTQLKVLCNSLDMSQEYFESCLPLVRQNKT